MSLSEGLLIVEVVSGTKYSVTEVFSTTAYTAITAASTNYIVSNLLLGLFLGKQNVVESGYVIDGYFAGAEII
jgi:hypothetical protein